MSSLFQAAPKGNRLHLGIFGRRNAGKSSLLNRLTRQQSSIVSPTAGTTTDPVEKPMEFLPLGPVLFIDTAGIDDEGALGALRTEKTRQALDRTDIAILVVDCAREEGGWSNWEEELLRAFAERQTPVVVVFGKCDLAPPSPRLETTLHERSIRFVKMANPPRPAFAADTQRGTQNSHPTDSQADLAQWEIAELRDALLALVPDDFLSPPPIVADLVPEGESVILVTPIDKEAPKGRLILPEVQTLRDLLDHGRITTVVQTAQLAEAIRRTGPKLVVTDSQAFAEVSRIVPREIPLTSFSILFARQKGDFSTLLAGARALGTLPPNAKILIAEACSHHPIAEDIGTEKIPKLLRARLGEGITIDHVQGHDFPSDAKLATWGGGPAPGQSPAEQWEPRLAAVIHCGGCVWNRREMLQRIARCVSAGVPITNYGLALAFLNGILDRAVEPIVQH